MGVFEGLEARDESLDGGLDEWFETGDAGAGEEFVERGAAEAVVGVGDGCDHRLRVPERGSQKGTFIPFRARPGAGIQLVVEIGVVDVEFPWIDTDNWSFKQKLDIKNQFAKL